MSPCLRALEELQRAGKSIAVGMTMLPWGFGSFFSTETQWLARLVYASMTVTLLVYSLFAIFSGMLIPECDRPPPAHHIAHSNSDYPVDYCRWRRYASVGYLSVWECDMCRRVLASIVCGSITGWERRRADRPAGIRTMAMVCLGACVFTIDSMFAFLDGPMSWDASRVSAAIPSGVGFLGAASIWKNTAKESGAAPEARSSAHHSAYFLAHSRRIPPRTPQVHGLTTATSVWLSAAIGILCGGALYVPAVSRARHRQPAPNRRPYPQSPTPPARCSPHSPLSSSSASRLAPQTSTPTDSSLLFPRSSQQTTTAAPSC